MEKSQDIVAGPIVAKRRGRKPKDSGEQELTLPDDLERSMSAKEKKEKKQAREKIIPRVVAAKKEEEEESKSEGSISSESGLYFGKGLEDSNLQVAPETAYELLGLRTVEPSMRPPLLELTSSNSGKVAWASKDCTFSGSMLRRARPLRTLEGAFFDRLELIRRIALSEVAKARSSMEAIAVLGVVFDREALILAAEEAYGATKGRALVLETSPGNYDELSARIAAERRTRRKRREGLFRVDNGKVTKAVSKGTTPYVYDPFRQGGAEVLYTPWRPRTTGQVTIRRQPRGSNYWIYEQGLEKMERARSPKTHLPMAKKWCSNSMEGGSPTSEGTRGDKRTERGNNEGNETINSGRSVQLYEGAGCESLTRVFNTQKNRRDTPHTRFEGDKSAYKGATFYSEGSPRRSISCGKQRVVMCFGFEKGLSTGLNGGRGSEVPGCSDWERDGGIKCAPLWTLAKSICIHKINKLGGWNNKEENWSQSCGLHRRFLARGQFEAAAGIGFECDQGAIRRTWDNPIGEESTNNNKTSGVLGISVVNRTEDDRDNRGATEGIQTSDQELVKKSPTSDKVEKGCGETHLPTRGCRFGLEACEKHAKILEGQEEWSENLTIGRGRGRFEMVAEEARRQGRIELINEGSDGINNYRCIGRRSRLCIRSRRREDRKEFRDKSQRGKHQCKRARGPIKMPRRSGPALGRKKSVVVFGQHHGKSSSDETRDTKHKRGNMGNSEEFIRYTRTKRNKAGPKICPRYTEPISRRPFATRTDRKRMAGSAKKDNRRLGALGVRPMWVHQTIDRTFGRFILGHEKDTVETKHRKDRRNIGPAETKGGQGGEKDPSIIVDKLCGANYADLGESTMVESTQGDKERMDRAGKNTRQKFTEMGNQELSSNIVDSLLNRSENALWARNTRDRYERIVKHFVEWCIARQEGRHKEEEMGKMEVNMEHLVELIQPYLESLIEYTSGENIFVIGKTLLRILGNYMVEDRMKELRLKLRITRQKANNINPPLLQPADAVDVNELRILVRRSERVGLTHIERQAVEILVVAFAATSRVAEICALKVGDVGAGGSEIVVRTKTFASSGKRHIKKVSNGCGLYPTEILAKRRKEAVLGGRRLLFSASKIEDEQLSSSSITSALKRACKRTGIDHRITAHSGRKGAAVCALFAGIPLVVIQSLGLWANIDSLQAYLGKAVREKYGVLGLLESAGIKGSTRKEKWVHPYHVKGASL